jgi:hypothetical protein
METPEMVLVLVVVPHLIGLEEEITRIATIVTVRQMCVEVGLGVHIDLVRAYLAYVMV